MNEKDEKRNKKRALHMYRNIRRIFSTYFEKFYSVYLGNLREVFR